ncbi:hypothetical protein HGRIS_013655 [Hohenbuehelia grisea]|uniref:Spindle pole body component n=1 Tax=Hohenbuehelia grisea TaxID=104357 RepID=A0ABR3IW56_9AGAR
MQAFDSRLPVELDDIDSLQNLKLSELPPVLPGFFIPRLKDAPQNPILDTLQNAKPLSSALQPSQAILPPELTLVALDLDGQRESAAIASSFSSSWSGVLTSQRIPKRRIASWDALRHAKSPRHPISSALISEQDQSTFASIRHHVKPRYYDSTIDRLDVSEDYLTTAMKLTMLGTSSALYSWNAASESFLPSWSRTWTQGTLSIAGKDEVVSESTIRRFLTIGTLLRRLELFLLALRSKYGQAGPTTFAFAHALSAIVDYLRDSLVSSNGEITNLMLLWVRNAKFEDVLVALSRLCDRDQSADPQEYPSFDTTAHLLLSRVHNSLADHIERQAPKLVRAVFAFILSVTSHDFIQEVCYSVGFSKRPAHQEQGHQPTWRGDGLVPDFNFGEEDQDEQKAPSTSDYSPDKAPEFFPRELMDVLPAAQKSLALLRVAQGDHPILNVSSRDISWFWTEEAVTAAWNTGDTPSGLLSAAHSEQKQISNTSSSHYKPELAVFGLFDLEPGTQTTSSVASSSSTLVQFIESFPDHIPLLAGTLPQLTDLVFSPLARHAARLSGALLEMLLQPTSRLFIPAHLQLLRCHLLLTSHAFRARLGAALFCDSDDGSVNEGLGARHALLQRQPSKTSKGPAKAWPVGLAPALLQRGSWPPVGADLSFLLRTVINDSLDVSLHMDDDDHDGRRKILEEAEFRLGFAIRDLPAGTGQEKWLDPHCIELVSLHTCEKYVVIDFCIGH